MQKRFKNYILKHKFYQALVSFLKRIRFRGGKVSLYFIIKIFIEKIGKDEILERANAVAFSFTLAVFPAIIFLFTLIPFIHQYIDEVDNQSIMEFIGQVMPQSMFETVESTIDDIVSKSRGGLLTFGALLSLFLATNGMTSLISAFNSRYKTVQSRNYFQTRLVATGLTFVLAFVLILAIVLLVVGQLALDYFVAHAFFDLNNYAFYLVIILRFVVLFVVFLLAIASLYYFGPEVHQKWGFFSLGATVATILCLLSSYAFSEYVTSFGTYNKLYGSIGVMIAFMVWIMLLSNILLICYELNASIHHSWQLTKDKRNHPMLESY